jgi:chromosome segregation ATPase
LFSRGVYRESAQTLFYDKGVTMSIFTITGSITRLQNEIADLHHKISLESKKEADYNHRIGQVQRSITKTTSLTTLKTKSAEIERYENEIAKVQARRADLHKRLSDKDGRLLKLRKDLLGEEEKERKKQAATDERERKRLADLEKKQQRARLAYQRQLQTEITNPAIKYNMILHSEQGHV